jgi:hypothetical protein
MLIRFAQALRGRGPRLPRAGRSEFCRCLVTFGIPCSQFFYPKVRPDIIWAAVERPPEFDARIAVTGIRGENGPDAEARFLWAVRYLLAVAHAESVQ